MKWRNLSQQQAARNSASCKLLIINNFTLVELLVVIAIITILMAMLMPAMASARKMAYRAECSGNLKQLGSAIIMYSDDYQWTPCAYNSAYPVSPRDLRCWTSQLFYGKYISGRPDYGSPYSGTVFACPSFASTYGNQIYGFRSLDQDPTRNYRFAGSEMKYNNGKLALPRPSMFILVADSLHPSGPQQWYRFDDNNTNGGRPLVHARHFQRVNGVCGDGHVDAFTGKDLISDFSAKGYRFNAYFNENGLGVGLGF